MNKDKQICGCITCNEAKTRGMSLGVKLVKQDMCPIAILTIAAFMQAFAQEQIAQQVLFANLGASGKITDDALVKAGPHFQSVMEGVQRKVEEMMQSAVGDETMIRAAFGNQTQGTPDGFNINEYVAGMLKAAAELDAEKPTDPLTELLAAILGAASKRH